MLLMQDRVLGETVGDFYEKSVQMEFILSESDELWWEVECGPWLGGASTGWLGQNWFKIVFYVIRRKNTYDGLLMRIVSKLLFKKKK